MIDNTTFHVGQRVRIKRDAQLRGGHDSVRLLAFRDARVVGEILFIRPSVRTEWENVEVAFGTDRHFLASYALEDAGMDHQRADVNGKKLRDALARWVNSVPSRQEREATLADKGQALLDEYNRLISEWGETDWTSPESDALDSELDIVREAIVDLLPQMIKALRFKVEEQS